MPNLEKVFISHSHRDGPLASALEAALKAVFPKVEVHYSSNRGATASLQPGADWLEWIREQVSQSDITLLLLTPESHRKSWIMWEVGAVSGVGIASGKSGHVVPLLYRLGIEEIPGPIRGKQAIHGEDLENMQYLLMDLMKRFDYAEAPETVLEASSKAGLEGYLPKVEAALADRPPPLQEADVAEWCNRIDTFIDENRGSEVGSLYRSLRVAFGGEGDISTPLDLRIHRRLGHTWLHRNRFEEAIQQLELARDLAPRDLYILHLLGMAYLHADRMDPAREILDRMVDLDPEVFEYNAECAGLKGRWHRQRWKKTGSREDLRQARDAYRSVLRIQPDSYFMADNVGQLSLLLGEPDVARDAFEQAYEILERLDEKNHWSHATMATASIVLDKEPEVVHHHLSRIRSLTPSPRDMESIKGGLERIREALELPVETLESWFETLGG